MSSDVRMGSVGQGPKYNPPPDPNDIFEKNSPAYLESELKKLSPDKAIDFICWMFVINETKALELLPKIYNDNEIIKKFIHSKNDVTTNKKIAFILEELSTTSKGLELISKIFNGMTDNARLSRIIWEIKDNFIIAQIGLWMISDPKSEEKFYSVWWSMVDGSSTDYVRIAKLREIDFLMHDLIKIDFQGDFRLDSSEISKIKIIVLRDIAKYGAQTGTLFDKKGNYIKFENEMRYANFKDETLRMDILRGLIIHFRKNFITKIIIILGNEEKDKVIRELLEDANHLVEKAKEIVNKNEPFSLDALALNIPYSALVGEPVQFRIPNPESGVVYEIDFGDGSSWSGTPSSEGFLVEHTYNTGREMQIMVRMLGVEGDKTGKTRASFAEIFIINPDDPDGTKEQRQLEIKILEGLLSNPGSLEPGSRSAIEQQLEGLKKK